MLKVNTAMIMELIKESVFEEKKTLLAMHQLGPYYWVRLVIPIAKSIALSSFKEEEDMSEAGSTIALSHAQYYLAQSWQRIGCNGGQI
jgi:hypothetical protein